MALVRSVIIVSLLLFFYLLYLGTLVFSCFHVLNSTYHSRPPEEHVLHIHEGQGRREECSAKHNPVGVVVRDLAQMAENHSEDSSFTSPSEMLGLTLET